MEYKTAFGTAFPVEYLDDLVNFLEVAFREPLEHCKRECGCTCGVRACVRGWGRWLSLLLVLLQACVCVRVLGSLTVDHAKCL